MYKKDNRIVATLDAGGTNFVFGAMKAGEFIIEPVSVPAQSHDLDLCLQNMVNGFRQVFDQLEEKTGDTLKFVDLFGDALCQLLFTAGEPFPEEFDLLFLFFQFFLFCLTFL